MHFTATYLKKNISALLLMSCLFAGLNSFSQTTYNWNGSASSDWNTPNNWTPIGVSGSASSDIVIIGSTSVNPSLSGNISLDQLTINSATLTLNGNILSTATSATISGSTIISGSLQCNGSLLMTKRMVLVK